MDHKSLDFILNKGRLMTSPIFLSVSCIATIHTRRKEQKRWSIRKGIINRKQGNRRSSIFYLFQATKKVLSPLLIILVMFHYTYYYLDRGLTMHCEHTHKEKTKGSVIVFTYNTHYYHHHKSRKQKNHKSYYKGTRSNPIPLSWPWMCFLSSKFVTSYTLFEYVIA